MYNASCEICGKSFSSEFSGRHLRKLGVHIINEHHITIEEYVLQYEHNGEAPLCSCGCGGKTKFYKWKFNNYLGDHKNHVKRTEEEKQSISKAQLEKRVTKHNVSFDFLKELWEKYNTPEYNSKKIEDISGIDFRTIKRYWGMFDVCTKTQITRCAKLHKSMWGNQGAKNGVYQHIEDSCLVDIYDFLVKHKGKMTLNQIRLRFGIKNSRYVLYRRLCDKFSKEEISKILKSGLSSREESDFYFVLCFYFGEDIVKRQFKIGRKIFDFLIGDDLIVEYDGAYWHRKKKKEDDQKDKIALDNGYRIFRVSDTESKDIEILTIIRRLIDECKT